MDQYVSAITNHGDSNRTPHRAGLYPVGHADYRKHSDLHVRKTTNGPHQAIMYM